MSTYQAALAGFLISVAVFYIVSIIWGGRPTNVKEFFHDANVPRNVFSLTAANFALGTGIAYILDGTQGYGILFLILPAMLLLGQLTFGRLAARLAPKGLFKRGTLVTGLSDKLDRLAGRRVYFHQFTTSYVLFTVILGLCYEIFVSAKWLSTAMLPTPGIAGQALISCLLMALTMSYTVTGGYRTVQRTDILQVFCGLGLMAALAAFLFRTQVAAPGAVPSALLPTNPPLLLGFATMALTPFTAQMYGLLNHSFASHQKNTRDRNRVFRRAATLIFITYMILAVAALFYNSRVGGASATLEMLLRDATQSGKLISLLIVSMAAVAMGAVVMSTVDTMMITIAQTGYEGFFYRSSNESGRAEELGVIRNWMLVIFPTVFFVLGAFWIYQPDTFSLLFAVASPCEALAPMIVCLIFLARKRALRSVLRPTLGPLTFLHVFYVLFPITLIAAFIALFVHSPWSRGVGFLAFCLSSILCVVLYRRAIR